MTSLLFAIVRKEIRELLRDGRYKVLMGSLLLLLISAGLSGAREIDRLRDERTSAHRTNYEQWLNQGAKNPHSAAHFGMYIFRSPSPLASFDRGILPYAGAAVYLEAHRQNLPAYSEATDATIARRLGEWTVARTLYVLCPLLIIFLGFASFARERELGLVLYARSLGANLRMYAFGKWMGLALAFAIPILPVIALMVGILVALYPEASEIILLRSGILLLIYSFYFLTLLALTIAISAFVSSARRALVILCGVWALWALVVPRISAEVAAYLHPTPRWGEVQQKVDRDQGHASDSPKSYEERIEELRAKTLAEYGVERVEDLPVNFNGIALLAAERWGDEAFDQHLGALHDSYRAQQSLIRSASLLSPALALSSLSMSLSSSSLDDELQFIQEAELYRRDFVQRLNEAVRDHHDSKVPLLADKELWGQVPTFQVTGRTTAQVIEAHHVELELLLSWFIASLALLFAAGGHLQRELVR